MINVDTVYQTVQTLINKEQRGYLTPQEFNLLANQAQQDIFEQYFYDLNAFRLRSLQLGGEQHEIGDSQVLIRNKINQTTGVTYQVNAPIAGCVALPQGRGAGKIFVEDAAGNRRIIREINPEEILDLRGSRWHLAGFDEYVYFKDGFNRIEVHTGSGQITSGCSCENVIGSPGLVYWGYTVVNEQAIYNPSVSRNFDLVIEEQSDIVIKILKLAGVSVEDPQLVGIATQEDQLNVQQENK